MSQYKSSDFDKDKLKNYLSDDSFNPNAAVGMIRKRVEELREITDLTGNNRSAKISNERLVICQDLLNAFETTMFAYGDGKKLGELTNGQQREILVMVDDILKGKREYAHFQLTKNADGIKELFSNKVFTIKKQENDTLKSEDGNG